MKAFIDAHCGEYPGNECGGVLGARPRSAGSRCGRSGGGWTSASGFASDSLREQGHAPRVVAHFVNRLVFCMFAEDVGLLPDNMFTRMLEQARTRPEEFEVLARDLFGAMSTGGRVGFEKVAWFNGGLFDDNTALPMEKAEIETALRAARLDWSEVDPSILGTLFERGLDPGKRAQLGAHYTDRDKIMRIVDLVIVRPSSPNGKGPRRRLLPPWNEQKQPRARVRRRVTGQRQNVGSTTFWNDFAGSPCSILPAARETSFTSPCTP